MTGTNPGNFGNVVNYETYVGSWSRRVSVDFLDWLDPDDGRDWLDVGCGTGAVSESIVARAEPRTLAGIDPTESFIKSARARVPAFAEGFQVGDALALPFPDSVFDYAVSGLGLNFIPDRLGALREIKRVTRSGGTAALYIWDYSDGMEPFALLWKAIVAVEPATRESETYKELAGMTLPSLRDLFADAGFDVIETTVLDVPVQIASFAHYWEWIEGGQGSTPSYAMALDPTAQSAIKQTLHSLVSENSDATIHLNARALAIRGVA